MHSKCKIQMQKIWVYIIYIDNNHILNFMLYQYKLKILDTKRICKFPI